MGIFKQHHAFDCEGIFIGDGTYLFVPDNSNYQGSSVLLFDEHNHPVQSHPPAWRRAGHLTAQQRARCVFRRCYKLVSLIHTNRAGEFFLYAGLEVTAGKDHENPILYRLVEQFIECHGRGVLKRLIVDRGFIDGPEIGRCKKEWGVDVLIPARSNMDIYQDVVSLAASGELCFQPWGPACLAAGRPPALHPKPMALHRPPRIGKREQARQKTLALRKAKAQPRLPTPDPAKTLVGCEVATVAGLKTFSTCPVPLNAIVNREIYADGHHDYWVLLDTAPIHDPRRGRQDYALRTAIEERHRQLKCFSDLEAFSSRAFNLIVNQVVFVLLTYSLLQWYLVRAARKQLNAKTRTRILELLRPSTTVILIYYQNYVACLSPLKHQELVLTLNEQARKQILAKTRRLRRNLAHQLDHARPP